MVGAIEVVGAAVVVVGVTVVVLAAAFVVVVVGAVLVVVASVLVVVDEIPPPSPQAASTSTNRTIFLMGSHGTPAREAGNAQRISGNPLPP